MKAISPEEIFYEDAACLKLKRANINIHQRLFCKCRKLLNSEAVIS